MALADLIAQEGAVDCDGNDVLGTGNEGCPFDWDRIVAAEFSAPSFRYEDAQNLEYVQEQQQLGNLVIVTGYESFVQTDTPPNINTVEGSGLQAVMGELPPFFTGGLNSGVNNWKALRSMNGKRKWNVAFYDVQGNKIYTKTKGGQSKGFFVQMLHTDKYKGKEGNNPSLYSQMLQLADVYEMDRMTWITSNNLDYEVSDTGDVKGVNDVQITILPVVNASTTLSAKVKLLDKTHTVLGLVEANFELLKNVAGTITTVNPSSVTYVEETDTYDFAGLTSATGNIYTLKLWDSVLVVPIILVSTGLLYKSDVATVTVTA